ncbi:AlpA family phage regulatory protein [Microbulbifer sp. HZ11]|uniref:helix-turn-helix transcriptional regulator n=1 Tax=Microbulbifer sp. HZ11 TaxID=1453501 RepID=UPI0009DC9882
MKEQDQNRILRRPEVAKLLGIGESTWSRWVSEGKAPQPTRLSSRTVGWPYWVILKFINDKSPIPD